MAEEREIEQIAGDMKEILKRYGNSDPIFEFKRHPTEGWILYYENDPEMPAAVKSSWPELQPLVQEAVNYFQRTFG